jgi:hypothetical protein
MVEKQAEYKTRVKVGCKYCLLTCLFATCFHVSFFLPLFFNLEDEGNMSLQNAGQLQTDYLALYPRKKPFITTAI